MGTWGPHAFEDDSACEILDELCKSNDLSLVIRAFEDVIGVGDVDAYWGTAVLVSINVLFVLTNVSIIEEMSDTVIHPIVKQQLLEFSHTNKANWDSEYANGTYVNGLGVVELAKTALKEVNSDKSDLYELWDESDSLQEWTLYLDYLSLLLGGM